MKTKEEYRTLTKAALAKAPERTPEDINLFADMLFEVDVRMETLRAENAELKAHIQRWRLHNYPGHHHKEGTHFNCEVCNIHWPCPTEVAKGWKE